MSLQFDWTLRAYDLGGNPKTGTDQFDGITSNELKRAWGRKWDQVLNGFDGLTFNLYLDDPMCATISELKTVVKLWVSIQDTNFGISYSSPGTGPEYAGIVTNISRQGNANTLQVTTMCPLWRLQTHFHLLAHRLVYKTPGVHWSDGELMWHIIYLVNNAFGSASFSGIIDGSHDAGFERTIAYIAEGSWAWGNIQSLLDMNPSSDIVASYHHVDGSPTSQIFDTEICRGHDISPFTSLHYNAGAKNLDDMQVDLSVQPGQFGNYGWAIGQPTKQSNTLGIAQSTSSDPSTWGWGAIGVYMWQADHKEMKTTAALGLISDAELDKRKNPIKAFTAKKSPVIPPYAISDMNIGDLVDLSAVKGYGMNFVNIKQRIYEMHHAMTENNGWQTDVLLADDYKGKYS